MTSIIIWMRTAGDPYYMYSMEYACAPKKINIQPAAAEPATHLLLCTDFRPVCSYIHVLNFWC